MADLKELLRLKHGDVYEIPCRACHGFGYVSGRKELVQRCHVCEGKGRVELVKPKQD
jgi:DnaJ-class molecular chaperone